MSDQSLNSLFQICTHHMTGFSVLPLKNGTYADMFSRSTPYMMVGSGFRNEKPIIACLKPGGLP